MTNRERILTAMKHGTPDRVPCAPDTNWTIPARLKQVPFWDIYYYHDPPLWKAYNDCVRYFGVDGFSHHGVYDLPPHPETEWSKKIIHQASDRLIVETTMRCPKGELTQEETFLINEPQTSTKKFITDFESQFDLLPYLFFGDVKNIRFDTYKKIQADMGENGVVGLCLLLPTLLTQWREPVAGAFFDYYDYHSQLGEFIQQWTGHLVQIAAAIIEQDVQPDFIFFPNSGMITLQSADIMREFSLPALKTLTVMFKQAGIVTSLHSCGLERALVEAAANETVLDCIDPLEMSPMGDCRLKEIKENFGNRIALKGNLHTTEVMLMMGPDGVERAAIQCLEDAMAGGGYILSTGDQCGRDTPDENIFKLVETCEKYGKY